MGGTGGLPATRPARTASDLLWDHEDPEAVAQLIADAIRRLLDYPGTFVDDLAPHAARFGLRNGDGLALLAWFLELVDEPDANRWVEEARLHVERASARQDTGILKPMTKADLHGLVDELPEDAIDRAAFFLVRLARGAVDSDQAWVWAAGWQEQLSSSLANLATGRTQHFGTSEEFLASL